MFIYIHIYTYIHIYIYTYIYTYTYIGFPMISPWSPHQISRRFEGPRPRRNWSSASTPTDASVKTLEECPRIRKSSRISCAWNKKWFENLMKLDSSIELDSFFPCFLLKLDVDNPHVRSNGSTTAEVDRTAQVMWKTHMVSCSENDQWQWQSVAFPNREFTRDYLEIGLLHTGPWVGDVL